MASSADMKPLRHRNQKRWQLPVTQLIACLVILAGTGVFLYPQVASWFSQKEQSRVTALAQERLNRPPLNEPETVNEQLERAHEYNDALASGAIYRANENMATGDGTLDDDTYDYGEILDLAGGGFMGRLRYDALAIDLPIYHGTSDEVLNKGVGHLEGTSLPVGGISTRSVLTAHRGLPSATLFNDLNKAAVGDIFTVSVLDQVLSYQVIETFVIEPDETEAIFADPERDLITLVTCTPLGINSHRILVTAERITPTPQDQVVAATEAPNLPGFPWWTVILGGVVAGLSVYIWKSGYQTPAARKNDASRAEDQSVLRA